MTLKASQVCHIKEEMCVNRKYYKKHKRNRIKNEKLRLLYRSKVSNGMCIRNFLSKNNKTKNKPKYVRIQIKYLKFVANHDVFLLEFYFFFRSLEHFGQYHFPLGLVVRPTQAKWNHSIGH